MLVRAERLFAPTHLAPPFNPALESLRPRNLPVCRLGVKSLVGAARAFWTSGRGGAGAVRVSGGHVRAVWSARRSSLWGRCGSRGRCGKKGRARGVTHGYEGTGECFAMHLGARCAAPAALLRCESQFPSDACAACAKANERAARGSQGMARALGCGQVGGGGPLAKVQRHLRGAASWRLGEEAKRTLHLV